MFDRAELESGSDPLDIRSPNALPPPEDSDLDVRLDFAAYPGQQLNVPLNPGVRFRYAVAGALHPNNAITFEMIDPVLFTDPIGLTGVRRWATRIVFIEWSRLRRRGRGLYR